MGGFIPYIGESRPRSIKEREIGAFVGTKVIRNRQELEKKPLHMLNGMKILVFSKYTLGK